MLWLVLCFASVPPLTDYGYRIRDAESFVSVDGATSGTIEEVYFATTGDVAYRQIRINGPGGAKRLYPAER